MELFLFRTSPQPEYLGKVKVGLVEPDQAVANVIGNTVHGKKIMEGDNVSSTLRSHSAPPPSPARAASAPQAAAPPAAGPGCSSRRPRVIFM